MDRSMTVCKPPKYSEDTKDKILELRNHQEAVPALLFAPDGQSTKKRGKTIGSRLVCSRFVFSTALYRHHRQRNRFEAFDTLGNPIWAEM
ncbi:hypothetical protein PsorP6_010980 [Peronosclerospora sorghi]|uniref:Uncharacterized protein n=1 Tax=Peronosclerospora sorghi TaxID=230839 RepID=A0ACC0VTI9_9STRA|nr:hypothetical protein PsorP6_010980 [Peronosclerospora sorghi]